MGAKAILKRYIHRNSGLSPVEPLELREHIASVAERSGLKVTEKELDELVGRPENGDRRTENGDGNAEAGKKGKTARNKKAALKSGDNTKTEI